MKLILTCMVQMQLQPCQCLAAAMSTQIATRGAVGTCCAVMLAIAAATAAAHALHALSPARLRAVMADAQGSVQSRVSHVPSRAPGSVNTR